MLPWDYRGENRIRSVSVIVCFFLILPRLAEAEAGPPPPSSRPSPALEIVPGRDVPHWSGLPIWGNGEAEKYGFDTPMPRLLGPQSRLRTASSRFVSAGGHIAEHYRLRSVKTERARWATP